MTVQADRKVPDIRFHKFEATWSRYSLAEAANFRRGSFPQPYGLKEWYDGPDAMPFVQVIDVTKELSLAAKTKQRISKIAQFKSVFVEKGSVVVTLQGSIGRVAILPYDAYIDRTLLIFKEYTYKTNTHFWAYLIQKVFDTEKQRAPGGIIKTITKEALSKFQIFTPVFEEQTQIGNYFQNLDSLINQHQHKHDTLLTLKIAMLQKMFPQAGATTPEIRFGGFDGDWVKKPLNCIADRYDNLRIPVTASSRIAGNTPYYGANGIQDYVQGFTHEGEYILVAEDGANDLKNYPVQYVCGKIWVNNHAHVLQAKDGVTETRFLKYAFSQINVETFLVGGGRAKLNSETMMNMELCVPTKIAEQQKIGSYFRTLDELISKHAIQLQKLKQIKSACLEKMFV